MGLWAGATLRNGPSYRDGTSLMGLWVYGFMGLEAHAYANTGLLPLFIVSLLHSPASVSVYIVFLLSMSTVVVSVFTLCLHYVYIVFTLCLRSRYSQEARL